MSIEGFGVTAAAYSLALLAHLGLLAYVARSGRSPSALHGGRWPVQAALGATALWAALCVLTQFWNDRAADYLAQAADLARYALWFVFLQALIGGDAGRQSAAGRVTRRVGIGSLVFTAVALVAHELGALPGEASRLAIAGLLSLPVCGLLMVEQLFRNLGDDQRWNAKPVCLGLACVFLFDVYLFAEGLLFGQFDADALAVRGAVHALAVPFLFVAARRSPNWIAKLHVSRAAAFYSATLLLAGLYLLFMAAVGYYVRFFGGDWGRALQLGLGVAGLAFLGMLVFSGAFRSWLRVFVGKHFYSYRYDYREQWLHFTNLLSAPAHAAGDGRDHRQRPGAHGRVPRRQPVDAPCAGPALCADRRLEHGAPGRARGGELVAGAFLRSQGWVIDLDEYRASPRRYGELALPTWLLGTRNAWLVVPLLVGETLQGFVVLARPLTALSLNWEVLDLLKTAGRQAAGHLAQMEATEALLDARKFEAFNKMSAFVVHDLKNIVAQLSLMLKNAERLHDNREFQQDMLLTVESSLEKMKRLMLQLREGAKPPGGSRGVEIAPIVRRLVAMARAQGRTLETDEGEHLFTRGHDDRLERVLGHLVQNAIDATPAEGRVWLRSARASGSVRIEVGDTGTGMSEEFVRTQLFRPFSSTKSSGMGIGSFESAQYIREFGGSISVESEPGQGTVFTVLLPAFEASQGSDLMRLAPR
jgi:signal transduction histidine kinase